MAATLHVNGLATISVGGDVLGYTVDGVTIEFIAYFEDIYTDLAGPRLPTDVMSYGEEARVTCELIVYDPAILAKVATRIYNGTAGTSPNGTGVSGWGTLMALCSKTTSLTIAKGSNNACGSEAEGGYVFGQAYMTDNHSVKIGTRVTRHTCQFRCLPNASGVLYSRS